MDDRDIFSSTLNRILLGLWLPSALFLAAWGFHVYPLRAMIPFVGVMLVWVNFYSTAMHYSFDAEEFLKLPVVGPAFVLFQSHHFPEHIDSVYRRPILEVVGELTPLAIINIVSAPLLFRVYTREVFVTWGTMMLVGGYAMICHRWAHQPAATKPWIAKVLQRAGLAISPREHWKHHALAAAPNGRFVPNFDLSFGWSNPLFNRLFKALPDPRFWISAVAVVTFTQVWVLAHLLRWLTK